MKVLRPLPGISLALLESIKTALAKTPAVHVYRSTDQTIPDATETAIIFSHSRFDYDGMWTIGAPSRLTCKTPGVYIPTGGIAWESSPLGLRGVKIKLNGTTWVSRRMHGGLTGKYMGCTSPPYLLEVGDYFELFASHIDTGGPLDVLSVGNTSPEFGMVRVA